MGVKAVKARAWSLPVVNHTWLEDCFIQWRLLAPATEKYTIFPPDVDFSKLLGERGAGVRGMELCEEEERKEGDDENSASENEDLDVLRAQMDVEQKEQQGDGDDVVLKKDAEEDIDMISMPDIDGPVHAPPPSPDAIKSSPWKANGKTKSAREISESVSSVKHHQGSSQTSFSKRGIPPVIVTPARLGWCSPVKKRRVMDEDDGDHMDIDREGADTENEKVVSMTKKKAAKAAPNLMDVDDEVEVEREPVTLSMKANGATSSAKERKTRLLPDLELSDDGELDRTPECYEPSSS